MKESRTIVAFDGLSLAGKSTMVAMLEERSENAQVIRENTCDPFRPTTSQLNKLLKRAGPYEAVKSLSEDSPEHKATLYKALEYASAFVGPDQRQALLAYMFTAGRQVVNQYVMERMQDHDLILDRWQMTGWAYQVGENYSWQEIQRLNQEFGIILPQVQFLLVCPTNQIPQRRAFREKVGVGTAGQMSSEREAIILKAFWAIFRKLKTDGMQIHLIENRGIPVENLGEQIRQAIPTYQQIENIVRETGFKLRSDQVASQTDFWLEAERLSRIQRRQIK